MLDLGGAHVRPRDILGVFDLDNTTVQKATREYLAAAEKQGGVRTVSPELPRTFVVTGQAGGRTVYLSPVSAGTLKARSAKL